MKNPYEKVNIGAVQRCQKKLCSGGGGGGGVTHLYLNNMVCNACK